MISNEEEDKNLLISMGFQEDFVNKVYLNFKPNNIETALNLLTENEGVFLHAFVRSEQNKLLCDICNKPKKNHIDFVDNDSEIINSDNEDIKDELYGRSISRSSIDNINENNKKKECIICLEKQNLDNFSKPDNCSHMFCNDCWYNYLSTKIDEGNAIKIKCMEQNCNSILDVEFVMNILGNKNNKDLIKKFYKFKRKQEIEQIPNHIFCPYKNCEGYSIKQNDNNFLKCNKGHKFCSKCKFEGWHKGTPCGEDERKDMELFVQWKKNHNVKMCPNCKAPIEKNEGCNHMTCINCKYEFCWLCNQKYTSGHFNNGTCRQFDQEENNLPPNILQIIEREERNNNVNNVRIYINERHINRINNRNRCCIFLIFFTISSCCSDFWRCLCDCIRGLCEGLCDCIKCFFEGLSDCIGCFCEGFIRCIKCFCEGLEECIICFCEGFEQQCIKCFCEGLLGKCFNRFCEGLADCIECFCEGIGECIKCFCEGIGDCIKSLFDC